MNKFRNWYVDNQDAITWFLIGVLTISMIDYASKGNWLWAGISAVMIVANYWFRKVRIK